MSAPTKEEIKERLVLYTNQTLRQVADENRQKAREAVEIAAAAEEIIKERNAA